MSCIESTRESTNACQDPSSDKGTPSALALRQGFCGSTPEDRDRRQRWETIRIAGDLAMVAVLGLEPRT